MRCLHIIFVHSVFALCAGACDDSSDAPQDTDTDGFAETHGTYGATGGNGSAGTNGSTSQSGSTSDTTGASTTNSTEEPSSSGEAETTAAGESSTGSGLEVCTRELCPGLEGEFSGSYTHRAVEDLAGTILNEMDCDGSFSFSLNFSQDPHIQGTATCDQQTSLSGFDDVQSATIEGTLFAGGALEASVTHAYSSGLNRAFEVEGTVEAGAVSFTFEGSMLPNPQSVEPWDVTGSLLSD